MPAPTIPTIPTLTRVIDPEFVREARARMAEEIEPQLEKLARVIELANTPLRR